MAMLGTQREGTVADFPIATAPIPARHQLQMSHQQLETFRLMLRFSESFWGRCSSLSAFRHITQHCRACHSIWGFAPTLKKCCVLGSPGTQSDTFKGYFKVPHCGSGVFFFLNSFQMAVMHGLKSKGAAFSPLLAVPCETAQLWLELRLRVWSGVWGDISQGGWGCWELYMSCPLWHHKRLVSIAACFGLALTSKQPETHFKASQMIHPNPFAKNTQNSKCTEILKSWLQWKIIGNNQINKFLSPPPSFNSLTGSSLRVSVTRASYYCSHSRAHSSASA